MRFVRKEFLSDSPDEAGSIIINIKTPQVKDFNGWNINNGDGSIEGSIRLADCGDHILLDFHARDQKSFEKRTAKLDKLIGQLQDMRKQYEEMWNSHKRDIKFWQEQEKKK